jgi:hypothetical protein
MNRVMTALESCLKEDLSHTFLVATGTASKNFFLLNVYLLTWKRFYPAGADMQTHILIGGTFKSTPLT